MKKNIPKSGKPVRGSRSARPVTAVLDLLGRRWTLRVIWELRDQPLKFRGLREKCGGLSPTILNQRLRELRDAGIVVLGDQGYALTDSGRNLFAALAPLHQWAESWQQRSGEQEIDS